MTSGKNEEKRQRYKKKSGKGKKVGQYLAKPKRASGMGEKKVRSERHRIRGGRQTGRENRRRGHQIISMWKGKKEPGTQAGRKVAKKRRDGKGTKRGKLPIKSGSERNAGIRGEGVTGNWSEKRRQHPHLVGETIPRPLGKLPQEEGP